MTHKIRQALYEALATLLAALVTLACTRAIDAETGPTVLAVVLCMSLSRSQLDRSLRGRIEAAVVLPLVSLAALGVAMLLRRAPIAGAVAFTAAIAASIWLRRFGPAGHKAGTLIALPFVTILMTPYSPPRQVSPALALALPTLVALLALFWVSVVHAVGQKLGLLRAPAALAKPALARPVSSMRPLPSTRMALQMGLALALSFAVGYSFFAERWAWIVLTAFIVNSGSQGRLDVLYKGLLRLAGAAAGTVIALATASLADVLRRRIADALAALGEALDPAQAGRSVAPFTAGLEAVTKMAPPFHALRLATRRWRPVQPADWIDDLAACRAAAMALVERNETPGRVRMAVGAARKALREPQALGPALRELRRVLGA